MWQEKKTMPFNPTLYFNANNHNNNSSAGVLATQNLLNVKMHANKFQDNLLNKRLQQLNSDEMKQRLKHQRASNELVMFLRECKKTTGYLSQMSSSCSGGGANQKNTDLALAEMPNFDHLSDSKSSFYDSCSFSTSSEKLKAARSISASRTVTTTTTATSSSSSSSSRTYSLASSFQSAAVADPSYRPKKSTKSQTAAASVSPHKASNNNSNEQRFPSAHSTQTSVTASSTSCSSSAASNSSRSNSCAFSSNSSESLTTTATAPATATATATATVNNTRPTSSAIRKYYKEETKKKEELATQKPVFCPSTRLTLSNLDWFASYDTTNQPARKQKQQQQQQQPIVQRSLDSAAKRDTDFKSNSLNFSLNCALDRTRRASLPAQAAIPHNRGAVDSGKSKNVCGFASNSSLAASQQQQQQSSISSSSSSNSSNCNTTTTKTVKKLTFNLQPTTSTYASENSVSGNSNCCGQPIKVKLSRGFMLRKQNEFVNEHSRRNTLEVLSNLRQVQIELDARVKRFAAGADHETEEEY